LTGHAQIARKVARTVRIAGKTAAQSPSALARQSPSAAAPRAPHSIGQVLIAVAAIAVARSHSAAARRALTIAEVVALKADQKAGPAAGLIAPRVAVVVSAVAPQNVARLQATVLIAGRANFPIVQPLRSSAAKRDRPAAISAHARKARNAPRGQIDLADHASIDRKETGEKVQVRASTAHPEAAAPEDRVVPADPGACRGQAAPKGHAVPAGRSGQEDHPVVGAPQVPADPAARAGMARAAGPADFASPALVADPAAARVGVVSSGDRFRS
jgi:hypothetical protein